MALETPHVNYKYHGRIRIRELAVATQRCECGHIKAIHGDGGEGACEGLYGLYEGRERLENCGCRRFQ